jgi:hypothetical protein
MLAFSGVVTALPIINTAKIIIMIIVIINAIKEMPFCFFMVYLQLKIRTNLSKGMLHHYALSCNIFLHLLNIIELILSAFYGILIQKKIF